VVACNSERGKICCSSLAADRATCAKQVFRELGQTKGYPGLVIQTGGLEGGAHDHIVVPKNTKNPETM